MRNPVARARQGFSLLEIAVTLAIVSVLAAVAVPSLSDWFAMQDLKGAARSLADAFHLARAEAIRTRTPHIVFFETLTGTDPAGNPLVDPGGQAVPILILVDAAGDCEIDAGDTTLTPIGPTEGVSWGVAHATVPVPLDPPAANFGAGSTFLDPAENEVNWVVFGANGIPVGFDAACTLGQTGSGGGALYVTNGERDYAIALTPLGATRVHPWDGPAGAWAN